MSDRTPVRKVLHILGDKSWKPQFKYLGSTKDIVGRRDYFAARGIECVEMQVKGRHDHICLEMLQAPRPAKTGVPANPETTVQVVRCVRAILR